MKKFWKNIPFLETRFFKGLIGFLLGVILIFNESNEVFSITSNTLGIIITIFSIFFLINEIQTYLQIKNSEKSFQIEIFGNRKIAEYLEKNNILYIYKPKEEKDFDFYLPEYDIYVKYNKENEDIKIKEKVKKNAKKREINYIIIEENKLEPIEKLHTSFMKKLATSIKKEGFLNKSKFQDKSYDKRGYEIKKPKHSNLAHRQIAYEKIYLKNRKKYPLPFSKYIVHHKDGDKKNNKIENLEILVPKEHENKHKKNF